MKKLLIISVHDVSPIFIRELEVIFKKLKAVKKEIFVVPNWDNRYDISKNKPFIKLVREEIRNDALLGLHGYSHMGRTFLWERLFFNGKDLGQNEFQDIDEREVIKKIKKGKEALYSAFKVYPKKFVAPRWILNRKYFDILRKFGFKNTESFLDITLLNKNKKIRALVCNFDFGKNKHLTSILSYFSFGLIYLKILSGSLIRIAIHPCDVRNQIFSKELKIIEYLLERGWKPLTTEELEEKF